MCGSASIKCVISRRCSENIVHSTWDHCASSERRWRVEPSKPIGRPGASLCPMVDFAILICPLKDIVSIELMA